MKHGKQRTARGRLSPEQKLVVKRAAKLRSKAGAAEHSISLEQWILRVVDSGKGDPSAGFACRHCGTRVSWEGAGSAHRNHCPNCLYSLHLDLEPGDRAADCGALMEPVALWVRKKGEWALIHRCLDCGVLSSNRIAADDNPALLLSLAARPLAAPPFPLDRLIDGEAT